MGDYALVAIPDKRTVDKLSLTWHGPYRITDVHKNYIFSVENWLTNKVTEVHGDRIQFYNDKSLNITEEIKNQFAFDTVSRKVEKICDARLNKNTMDVEYLVKWKGVSDMENSWCPDFSFNAENPDAVREFLKHAPNHPALPFIRVDNLENQNLPA